MSLSFTVGTLIYLQGKVKKYTGSASRRRYLQQMWELMLENDEIHTELEELSSKVEELEDELCEVRAELSHAHQDIRELEAEKLQAESELVTTTKTLELSRVENQCLRDTMQMLATSQCPELKVSLSLGGVKGKYQKAVKLLSSGFKVKVTYRCR